MHFTMRGLAAAMPTMARRTAARAVAESIAVGVISAVWFQPGGGVGEEERIMMMIKGREKIKSQSTVYFVASVYTARQLGPPHHIKGHADDDSKYVSPLQGRQRQL